MKTECSKTTSRALPVSYSYSNFDTAELEKELTEVFNRNGVDSQLNMRDNLIAGMVVNFLITMGNAMYKELVYEYNDPCDFCDEKDCSSRYTIHALNGIASCRLNSKFAPKSDPKILEKLNIFNKEYCEKCTNEQCNGAFDTLWRMDCTDYQKEFLDNMSDEEFLKRADEKNADKKYKIVETVQEEEQKDDIDLELEDFYPKTLLTDEEMEQASKIAEDARLESVKYIFSVIKKDGYGLKGAKTYFDLYIDKRNKEKITNKKNKEMNKEWKQEDLDKFSEMYRVFKERCKHVVKIINEIYVEVTGKREPFCFEDFYIDEQKVFFNVCYADGPLRKNMRSFPCCLLTMNEDSELKREILKLLIVGEEDELSVDELVEIVKNINKPKTLKETGNCEEIEVLDEEQPGKKPYGDCCTDGRFEMIERVKTKLIEATNIETADDEMKVIDNIQFRFWQMGWLEMIDDNI